MDNEANGECRTDYNSVKRLDGDGMPATPARGRVAQHGGMGKLKLHATQNRLG